MIALLRGVVESIGLDQVVVSAGGVGFGVRVTPVHAQSLTRGDEAVVHTAMVVREDSLTLYGFASADERDVFERLMGVTGIGPKTALAALAVLRPDDLRRAVRDQDIATLQKIPGVGRKSAQRMALEVGGKLGAPAQLPEQGGPAAAPTGEVEAEVRAALVGLGWSEAQAAKAVDALSGQGLGASDMLRSALVSLGGGRG